MEIKDFKKELKKLEPTPMQQEIIDTDLSLSVTAGAGSGKTKVLVDKIINLLGEEELELEDLVIITFTNKAAVEMKERLRKRLYFQWLRWEVEEGAVDLTKSKKFWRKQIESCEMANISTIHKFCEGIIRKFGLMINQPTNFKVGSVKDFLKRKARELIDDYANRKELSEVKSYKLREFIISFYEDNENKGLEFNQEVINNIDLTNKAGTDWKKITQVFIKIYSKLMEELEEYKWNNNILTSNDLIKYAVRILEESEYAVAKLADEYQALFIDEFQDTNRYQYKLVEKLEAKGVGVFVVGDEKQSIYRFRGADVETYIEMNRTSDVINEQKYLLDNFRTDERLLQTINQIFAHDFRDDTGRILKIDSQEEFQGLEPQRSSKQSRNYDSFLRVSFEYELAEVINYLYLEDGVDYNDITILFRSNWDLNQAAQELKRETEIPVEVVGGRGFYASKPVIDLFKLLYHVLHGSNTSYKELRYTDFYKAYCRFNDDDFTEEFLKELGKQLRILSVDNILEFIYTKCKIRDYYKQENLFQELANLEKLKDLSINVMDKDFIQPIEFCNYLGLMIETGKEEDEAEVAEKFKEDEGVVSLISIHKAKGLEDPVIILPKIDKTLVKRSIEPKIIFDYQTEEENKHKIAFKAAELYDEYSNFQYIEQNKDPDYDDLNKDDKEERLEEELRILYVALTRVENMLILLGDKEPDEDEVCWANWLKGVKIEGKSLLKKYRFSFNN